MNERDIFMAALQFDDAQRAAYLDSACSGDSEIRQRVNALMHAFGAAGSFMQHPAAEEIATLDRISTERPGTVIGRYKLLEQVGEGGMGVVYVAEQTEPVRRRVALKIIKPGMDTKQVIARFEAERQALAMMDHPNIAKILDAGTVGEGARARDWGLGEQAIAPVPPPSQALTLSPSPSSRPYFVMELVRGLPITDYCDKARLSLHERLALFMDVCQAVQHAHQKGIIHRDLKPSNVMVTTNDGRPVVKVIDFGVAKAIGGLSLATSTSHQHPLYTGFAQLVGTPLYMSPEQAELTSHDVDTRSDVYSLGVLVYELLTGQTPFDKETLAKVGLDEVRRMIREDEPLRPSRRFSTLGAQAISTASQHRGLDERRLSKILCGELDWIVMKALEKDRSRRYESASALATDIQRYLSDEPVLACPPTTMYRFQKFARKHKASLTMAAALAACLLLGTTVSAWQAARAAQAEAQANTNAAQAQEKTKEATEQRDEAQKQRDEVKALYDKLAAKEQQLQRTLYASNMNLASNAWETGAVVRVHELLNQHRPKPGETDLRGFEWHYLNRLSHAERLSLKGHSLSAYGHHSVAFSPDGKRLASAGQNQTVKIWEAASGRELAALKGHIKDVVAVAFSADGKRLASSGSVASVGTVFEGGRNGPQDEIKIWDAETGEELLSIQGHEKERYRPILAFSPDGKQLATGLGEVHSSGKYRVGRVSVWDTHSGQQVHALKQGPELEVEVRKDPDTGEEIRSLKGHSQEVTSVAYSPSGKHLASVGGGVMKIWDTETGQEVRTIEGAQFSVAYSPDGKRLASGSKIFDAQTGRELLALKQPAWIHTFSPNNRYVAGVNGKLVMIWDAQTGREVSFKGHGEWVNSVVFSPDSAQLASGARDGTVKIWEVNESRALVNCPAASVRLAYTSDLQRVAGSFWDTFSEARVKVWDTDSGREVFTKGGQRMNASGAAISPDGKCLAKLTSYRTEVGLWDAETGRELFVLRGHQKHLWDLAFSPDGKRLATTSNDSTVKLWDVQTGHELLTFTRHKRPVGKATFSPDGQNVASADGTEVKIWNSYTGQELLSFEGRGTAPVYSPDGKRLASITTPEEPWEVHEIKVWEAQTGEELLSLKGHTAYISSVAFSPDGKRLASASRDKLVKLWDTQTGQEMLTLIGSSAPSVAFSPDGHRLAVGIEDHRLKIYDATPLPEKP